MDKQAACELEAVIVRAERAEADAVALAAAIRDFFNAQRLREKLRTDEDWEDANRAEDEALDRLWALVYEAVECVTCEGDCRAGDPTKPRQAVTAAHFRFDTVYARSDSPRLLNAERDAAGREGDALPATVIFRGKGEPAVYPDE